MFHSDFFFKGHGLCVVYFHSTWKTADAYWVMVELNCPQFINWLVHTNRQNSQSAQRRHVPSLNSIKRKKEKKETHTHTHKLQNSVCSALTQLWKMAPPSPWEEKEKSRWLKFRSIQIRWEKEELLCFLALVLPPFIISNSIPLSSDHAGSLYLTSKRIRCGKTPQKQVNRKEVLILKLKELFL